MKKDELIETRLDSIETVIEKLLLMGLSKEEDSILNSMLIKLAEIRYIRGELSTVEELQRWGML
jgi:hypothetical protein